MHGVSTVIENRPGAATVLGVEATSAQPRPTATRSAIVANFAHHPSELQEAQLRSADELRAGLPAGQFAAGHRGQQHLALQDAHRVARRRPRQARRAVPRQRRPGEPPAHRHRAAQASGQGQHGVRAVQRKHAGAECAARRTRRQRHVELFGGRELVNAGKLRALAIAGKARLATWPNVPTVAEQGFKDYAVEAWYGLHRASQDAEGQDRRAVEMVRGGDARARAQAEMGACRASRRSAARPRRSPRICASSRRTTLA